MASSSILPFSSFSGMLLLGLPLKTAYAAHLTSTDAEKKQVTTETKFQPEEIWWQNVMLFLHSNTFASPPEPFLAFGFEQDRASLNSSLRKQPGTNKKKKKKKADQRSESISPTT